MRSGFFALMVGLNLISCSSDDNGGGSQEEIDLTGTWVLTQINLSAAIDANFDDITSANLLDEVDCLNGTLVLESNLEWNSTEVVASLISPITGNLYNVSCSEVRNQNGNWGVSGSNLLLVGSINRTFLVSGNQLIENLAQDLPGIRTMVYTRQ